MRMEEVDPLNLLRHSSLVQLLTALVACLTPLVVRLPVSARIRVSLNSTVVIRAAKRLASQLVQVLRSKLAVPDQL